ncbi:dihydrofolate reductase family protein [Oceanobacillus jeddahense]|uniref:Dihydrofolate reductase family protein n=1 Tax=Oceanobacillus jeddahense TaxID=1462527 RepID=A0ABY5JQF8_9BACI|nr:dihydrofolate reductase family protein [Oceanobacillus jeddahense]UUI01388.1 dihydrofolate reductase family protein [Oceanobacillus jeddahense]
MGKVVIDMSMSLDGFIAGLHDSQEQPLGENGAVLHSWLFNGDMVSKHSTFFKLTSENRDVLDCSLDSEGAGLTGRRTFDIVGGWGGSPPGGSPMFILTHYPPEDFMEGDTPFTFVTDGIESAIKQAKAAAGNKVVGVSGASTAQQCLAAGLADEIHIHLIPVLLGKGIRLFESLPEQIQLELMRIVTDMDVTHLFYHVK